jgi:hypothetical protein
MREYLSENLSQIGDGLLFGLGVLAVYLGAVFTGALIRSLGGVGGAGLTMMGRYVQGWVYYLRGDDRNTINVTINMIVDGCLKFDTLVADRRVHYVWPNSYRVQMIRRAARRTTVDDPVLHFPQRLAVPRSLFGRRRLRFDAWLHAMVATASVMENGREQRVLLMREDDYKAAYAPLISLISEKCSNDNAIDLALGRPMEEYRFVIALTFEKLHNRRARHLRAMVMWEETLRNLPPKCPRVEFKEHETRYRTLQAIARQYALHPERFALINIWRPSVAGPIMPGSLNATERLMLGAAAD